MIRWLRQRLCRHQATYLERRPLHGEQVLHWVCFHCRASHPLVNRSPEEHRRVRRDGALVPFLVTREPIQKKSDHPAAVLPMRWRTK